MLGWLKFHASSVAERLRVRFINILKKLQKRGDVTDKFDRAQRARDFKNATLPRPTRGDFRR